MTTETTTVTLTPDDVKALSTADNVVFRHRAGVTTIEPGLTAYGEQRIYTAAEQRLFPDTQAGSRDRDRKIVVSGVVSTYDEDETRQIDENSQGFAMIGASDPGLRTVLSLLRPRDEVLLSFVGDTFSNMLTRRAGLHADALRLTVHRGRNTRLTFLLYVSVCADNSARMVKP